MSYGAILQSQHDMKNNPIGTLGVGATTSNPIRVEPPDLAISVIKPWEDAHEVCKRKIHT